MSLEVLFSVLQFNWYICLGKVFMYVNGISISSSLLYRSSTLSRILIIALYQLRKSENNTSK